MADAVLYFDPSAQGAGAVLQGLHLVAWSDVAFGTDQGDEALDYLFAFAVRLQAGVSCEEPLGHDARGNSIRRAQLQRIGILQDMARRMGLAWLGTVAPGTAKLALTGSGRATKPMMIRMANLRFVAPLQAVPLADPDGEHCADAIGGAVAALQGRFVVHRRGRSPHRKVI